ncbi:hypothetical protein [Gordonia sp. i37]|uniref:hypothetical protein n=1 Tax=Gordonia sp. i37 TaxID=1961707 RepID=UPI0009AD2E31|nr:hypothetical protein [Gordonia sp. i37]OPX14378.1 hypothetical protein B1964_15470 [Gordonia sp. i37]
MTAPKDELLGSLRSLMGEIPESRLTNTDIASIISALAPIHDRIAIPDRPVAHPRGLRLVTEAEQ